MFGGVDTNHALIGAVVALAVVGAIAVHISTRSKARRTVRDRSPLSAAEFGALFASEAEAALAPVVRDRLRAYISVDPALVRPDDKLCEELQLAVTDSLDANAFVADVEKVVGTKIPDKDAEGMFTLRDIVSYLATRKQ
jgi:acyl carrier protein